MWKERLKRLIIISLVAGLTMVGTTAFIKWRDSQRAAGEMLKLPSLSINEQIKNFGVKILGAAFKSLPIGSEPKVTVVKEASEPITQPVENIQKQTDQLIESIKRLPADQIEAIKKQIYKEFCQQLIKD